MATTSARANIPPSDFPRPIVQPACNMVILTESAIYSIMFMQYLNQLCMFEPVWCHDIENEDSNAYKVCQWMLQYVTNDAIWKSSFNSVCQEVYLTNIHIYINIYIYLLQDFLTKSS